MATIEQGQVEAAKKPVDANAPNTWEAMENVKKLMNGIVTEDQVPPATLDDIRDWFSNHGGKEELERILDVNYTKLSSRNWVYTSFASKRNRNPERQFRFPETPNALYELVTGKSWTRHNRKFPEIFDTLGSERLHKRYMTPNELGIWYKTPDIHEKTGRDYILQAIPDNFYNAWHSIALKINTRRKQDGLPMIQESPTGIIQAVIRGVYLVPKQTSLLDMLVAFGEDMDKARELVEKAKG